MMTTARLERRLAKFEVREHAQRPSPTQYTLPIPSPEVIRAVLKMLVEMGALVPPPVGQPDRWQKLRQALFLGQAAYSQHGTQVDNGA